MSPVRARACARLAAASLFLAVLPAASKTGALQDDLEARWRGAWVVTSVETQSDCQGFYNDNRVNGQLVNGRGRLRFNPGELARVDSVDLKRSRLDLRLTFAEPVLTAHQDGPFRLYDEARCQVDLQIELPRDAVKGGDTRGIDAILRPILGRHLTEQEARASASYNGREREPYPPDYERTLHEHAVWKAKQVNSTVQTAIFNLVDETSRIPDRINPDPDYMAGFVKGVEAGRSGRGRQCADLIAVSRPPSGSQAPAVAARASEADRVAAERQARATRGYQDGLRLTLGVDAVRRLPGCFVQVPGEDAPAGQ